MRNKRLRVKSWSIESNNSKSNTVEIKRPATLFPGLFKKFVLFITVALCTFFGCIYFFNGGVGLMQGQGTLAEQPFLQLVGNIMGITNISVGKNDKNFELILKYHDDGTAAAQGEGQAEPTDLNLAVKGYVVWDFASGIDVNLNFYDKIKLGEDDDNLGLLIVDDSEPPIYAISVNSVGNTLFFGINGNLYKIDTTPMVEGGASIDLSSVLDLIKQNLPFDLDAIITSALGFGIDELDMEALGQNPTKLKTGGYQFEIRPASRPDEDGNRIFSPLKAIIKTDANYNIVSAEIDQINLENYKIRFSAPDVVMNSNKIKVEQQTPEEFVDLSYVNQFVEYGANLFKYNQFVGGQATFTLADKQEPYVANFTLENGEKKNVLIETNIDGLALQVAYKDDFIYVKADDVKVKVGASKKWLEALDRILSKHFDISIEEKLNEFLDKLKQKLPSENIENTIFGFLTKNLSNPDNLMKILPQNSVLDGNALTISWKNGETLTLTREPQTVLVWEDVPQEEGETEEPTQRQVEKQIYVLDTASVNLAKESGSIDFDVLTSGIEFDTTGYENADALLELEKIVDEILTAKKFGGNATITYKNEPISGDYVVNFETNKVCIKFVTELFGENVEIYANLATSAENEISSGEIYLVLGQDEFVDGELSKSKVVIRGDYSNLDEYVEKITAFLPQQTDQNVEKEEVKSVVAQIKEVLAELVKFDVTIEALYALEKVEVKEDTANITISYEDIVVELSAKVAQEKIVLPTENENLLNLLDKASALKAFIEKQEFAFGFTLKYNNIDLAGKVYINLTDKNNPIFEIDGIKLGKDVLNVRYDGGMLYVIYDEKVDANFISHKMKIDINQVMAKDGLASVIESLLPTFGVEKNQNALPEFLTKMFGQDLTKMSVSNILKNATLDVSGNIENLKVCFEFMGFEGEANIAFAGQDISSANVKLSKENKKEISLGVSVGETSEFESEFTNLNGFYNLISQHSGNVTVNLYGIEFTLKAELDLTKDIRLQLSGNVLGIELELLLHNNKLSLKLGDVVVSGTIDKNFVEQIQKLIPKSEQEKKGIEELLDLIDTTKIDISQIVKLAFGEELSVSKQINDNISVFATLNETSNISIGEPKTSNDTILGLILKINSIKNYVEGNEFAFDFAAKYNNIDISSTAYVNLTDEKNPIFEIDGIKLGEDEINLRYDGGILYVIYSEKVDGQDVSHKMKINLKTVMAENGLASVIENMLPNLGIKKDKNALPKFLTKMFGQDVTQMKLAEILNNVTLTSLSGNLLDLSAGFEFMAFSGTAEIMFSGNNVSGVKVELQQENKKQVSISATVDKLNTKFEDLSGFYNLISQHKGTVILDLFGYETTFNLEIDLIDKLYAKLTGSIFGVDVEFILLNDTLSLKLDKVVVSGKLNETLIDEIKKLLPEKDKKTVEEILDSINTSSFDLAKYVKLVFGDSLTISKQINDNISISATLKEDNVTCEQPKISKDNLVALLSKITPTQKFVEGKEFAFGFSLKYNNIVISGTAYVNLVDEKNPIFEIDGIKLGADVLNVRYAGGMLYLIYNEKVDGQDVSHKMKIDINQVMAKDGLASVIENLMPAFGVEKNKNALPEFLTKMFGQDLTQMSISDILKNISLDLKGTISDLTADFEFMGFAGTAEIKFTDDNLSEVSVAVSQEGKKQVTVGVSVGDVNKFESAFTNLDGYYNLISKHSGKVTVNLYGKEFILEAKLDLTKDIRLQLSGNILGLETELLLHNNKLSLKLGEVVFSGTIDKNFIDEFKKLLPEKEKKSIEELLNLIDTTKIDISSIVKFAFGEAFTVSKQINDNISVSATLNEWSDTLEVASEFSIEEPKSSGNALISLLPKVNNLIDYISTGKFGAKFNLNYNKTSTRSGLDLSGNVKFVLGNEKLGTTNELLVTIDNVFGEPINIRMHFDKTSGNYVLYISIGGNIKIKQAIQQKTASTEVVDAVEQAAKSTFGVDLDFGILANIIDLFKLDVKGILDSLELGLSYDENLQTYNLTVDTKNKTVATDKLLLDATIKFVDDKLTSDGCIAVDVYDGYLSGSLSLLENVSIDEFSEEAYKGYKDYISGLLGVAGLVENETQVAEDIFAFSSDIAIRYMFSDFYGKLTVMLIKDDNFKASFGGLRPVVQLYTTSLGLSTYVYLVDEISNGEIVHMIYADVNGLMLKTELTTENINHILDFIQNELGISLKQEQESEGQAEAAELEEIEEQVETTKEAFRVVIPLLTNIFAKWTEVVQDEQTLRNGIQIDVDGKLVYAEASWFENIFAQILVDTTNGIAPQSVVLGANITDGNTKPFAEDTKYPKDENGQPIEWHLKDAEGNVLEIPETQNLNFAVYLTNFTLGDIGDIDQKFGGEVVEGAHRLKNLTQLQTNNGLAALTEFHDLDEILPAIKSVYDYFKGFNYKIVIDKNEGGMINLGDTKITNIGADITVEVAKVPDGTANPSGIKLFNGRSLKVQAYLDFEISSITDAAAQTWSAPVRHLIDILYDSQGEGLYVSYTHGKNINTDDINSSKKLRVFIKNESMSELIAMVFAAFRVNLGDELAEELNIVGKNQTDFTFFQELMGIEDNDKSGDMTRVSTLLNNISSALQLLKSLKFEKVDGVTSLSAMIDLSEFDFKAGDKTLTSVKLNLDETSGKLKLSNIEIHDNSFINLKVKFNDFVSNFDYLTRNTQEHFDFSSLPTFVDMLVNTLNTKGLNLHMSYEPENEDEKKALVLLGGLYTLKLGIDLEIKINAQNKLEVYGEIRTQGREVVTLARAGLYGHTYTNQMPVGTVEEDFFVGTQVGRKVSTIELNFDKAINEYKLVVTQYNERNEAGDLKLGGSGNDDWTYKMSDIGKDHGFVNKDGKVEITSTNIFKILAQVLGLTNDATIDVVKLVASMNPEPTVEQLLLGYKVEDVKDDSGNVDGKDYILSLSGSNLTGVSEFRDFDLHIVSRESTYTKKGRKLNFIDQIKATLDIAGAVKINLNLHSKSGQRYMGYTDMPNMPSHTFITNQTYRDEYCKNKITFVENGAEDIDDIYEYEGGAIDLPTYETYVVDDKDGTRTKTTRVFDGWWTTENFDDGTRFDEKIMPQQNVTLYAKWIDTVEYYRTISFVTNEKSVTEESITKIEGADIILPWYSQDVVYNDVGEQKLTRKFDGWWTTSTFEEGTRFDENKMPTYDVVLYAKWNDKIEYYYTLKFETGIDEVLTYTEARVLEGDVFEFKTPTQQQITEGNTTTYYTFVGWFTTADYQEGTQWTTDYMPAYDLTLYAKWDIVVETTYQITLLDNNVVVDTLRGIDGKPFDLTGRNKVVTGTGGYDTEFYWDADYTHKLTAEDFIMPETDIEIHIRNWYTVTYTSEYGNTAQRVYRLLQGASLTPPTQTDYSVDFDEYREYYHFLGYEKTLSEMPNENMTIKANWELSQKYFYTIVFKLDWYKPAGSGCSLGHHMKLQGEGLANLTKLVEGDPIVLTGYVAKCKCYKYATEGSVSYVGIYSSTSWGLNPWADNTAANASGSMTSYTLNPNDDKNGDRIIELYACWEKTGK